MHFVIGSAIKEILVCWPEARAARRVGIARRTQRLEGVAMQGPVIGRMQSRRVRADRVCRRMVISLLLVVQVMLIPGEARARARCGGTDLRVMTYNIRLDTSSDGPNRWALRRDLLVGQVRLLKPAVLGLQEVLPVQRDDLVADLPGFVSVGGGRDDGKLGGEAAPLLIDRGRFRIAESGMFWLSPTPAVPSLGWDAGYRRVASWARLVDRTNGMQLLAISTHWDHVGVAARLNSARLMRDWIARNRRGEEDVILLGDFNAPLSEASLQTLLNPPMLSDSRALSQEPALGATITFNGWKPIPVSGATIDHVLVSPGLAVKRYHALAEHFDGRLASDHFPVIADLAPTVCATRPRA